MNIRSKITSPCGILFTVYSILCGLKYMYSSSFCKLNNLSSSDAKTSRLTDVLQQFRDGVYPQYNPEKVSAY